jgi:hypothetical protein
MRNELGIKGRTSARDVPTCPTVTSSLVESLEENEQDIREGCPYMSNGDFKLD